MGDAVADVGGIETVSNVRQDIAQIDGDGANLTGLDDQISAVYDFRWEDGSDEVLTQLGATAHCCRQRRQGSKSRMSATPSPCVPPVARRRSSSSAGIYEGSPFYPLLGTASVSQEAFDELYERPRNRFTLLNTAGRCRQRARMCRERARELPDTSLQTREECIDKEDQEIQQFLSSSTSCSPSP